MGVFHFISLELVVVASLACMVQAVVILITTSIRATIIIIVETTTNITNKSATGCAIYFNIPIFVIFVVSRTPLSENELLSRVEELGTNHY